LSPEADVPEPTVAPAPTVGVVVATHNRPQLMRRALASILEQEYDGGIEVVLVFDRSEPDESLVSDDPVRPVRVMTNTRTPGLAGARNSGILALRTDLVGFCDDDDVWLPGKLAAQVDRLRSTGAEFVTTAMRVDYGDQSTVRQAYRDTVTVQQLARSRMAMLHSSSFLFVRSAMVDGFGLVDETIPQSMGEDWDLLLRAARRHPVAHVDEPYVAILWGQTSYFNDAWTLKNAAHEWLLDHHPEISQDPVGLGLMYGKLAFGHAATKHRSAALRYAWKASRANWREARGLIALLVVVGVPSGWVVAQLNKRGHGI
jgi:glycosyltransferase involved in cell wall biosynthesis